MASMNFTSFNICKANIPPPRPSLSFPQKSSRVSFTSPFKQSSQRTHSIKGDADDAVNYATGKSLSEIGGDAKEKLKEGQEKARNVAGDTADKAEEDTNKAVDAVEDTAEKTKEAVTGALDAVQEAFTKDN